MKLALCLLALSFSLSAQTVNVEFLETVKNEGDQVGGLYTAEVTLSKSSQSEIRVSYTTKDGQAVAGKDYKAASGELLFAPGETSKIVQVVAIGDEEAEEYLKQFDFELSNPVNATLGKSFEILTIKEDDIEVSLDGRPQVQEGDDGETSTLTFNVSMKHEFGETVLVGFQSLNEGSATAGQDFDPVYSTLGFQSGETEKTFSVTVNGDEKLEPNETLFVEIWSNDKRVNIANAKSDGYIIDDEGGIHFVFDLEATDVYQGTTMATGQSSGEVALEKNTTDDGEVYFHAWWTPWEYQSTDTHAEIRDLKGRTRVRFYSDDGSFSAESMVVEWATDGPYCELINYETRIACPWMDNMFMAQRDIYERGAYVFSEMQEVNAPGNGGIVLAKQKVNWSEDGSTYRAVYKIVRKEE